jgi:RHS repeat-associated protein
VDHIVFASNATNVMTTQNTYDNLNRLTGRSSVSSASSVVNFQYQYNAASQRMKVTLIDGSYWLYGYDALGQVTSAVKYFWDGTPYPGQQFGFGFDTIGNRTSSQAGGDSSRSNLRQTGYTNNALNQIVSQNVPGSVDIMGLTLSTNTVKVNGTNAYQKWEYFREQLGTNNGSASQWVGVSVTAPGQTTISGGEYLAQNPETNLYDLDGNQTSDGRFNYTWDGENRLISAISLTNAPIASMSSNLYTYDYMGRRIQKVVATNSGSGWVVSYINKFVYDGWNVVAILDASNNVLYTFTWGTDMSGSMQGAGGVGGLLSMTVCTGTNAGTYFPCYDGNGNVVALVNAANGNFAGNWEYGPFGEVIRATGPMAKVNPFMFSTKFYDWETGLYYYGHRYYNPSTGRWLSRDPVTEPGFILLVGDADLSASDPPNPYSFEANSPLDDTDYLGEYLQSITVSRLPKNTFQVTIVDKIYWKKTCNAPNTRNLATQKSYDKKAASVWSGTFSHRVGFLHLKKLVTYKVSTTIDATYGDEGSDPPLGTTYTSVEQHSEYGRANIFIAIPLIIDIPIAAPMELFRGDSRRVYAHEIGHTLGCIDQYDYHEDPTTGQMIVVIHPGFEDNIMANPDYSPDYRNIEEIIAKWKPSF